MVNLSKTNLIIHATSNFLSANAGNFGQPKVLVCGNNFNYLPNNKTLDLSKMKAFADDNLNVNQKLKFAVGRVENIVGKGENAENQYFILFPQCFQKPSSLGH